MDKQVQAGPALRRGQLHSQLQSFVNILKMILREMLKIKFHENNIEFVDLMKHFTTDIFSLRSAKGPNDVACLLAWIDAAENSLLKIWDRKWASG